MPTLNRTFSVKNGIDVANTIIVDSSRNVTNVATVNSTGNITTSAILKSNFSAGDEGGEIQLALAAANTTLSGSVVIDVNQNRLRVFESGGTNRGAYIDLAAATAGVGSNLLGSSGSSSWIRKTTTYTAVTGNKIIADTSGGGFTITLPATPATGDYVSFTDGANFATNNLTVARNGSTIEGIADDVLLDIAGTTFDFIYDGTTWEVVAALGERGIQGVTGTGTQGVQGVQGTLGAQGVQGITGSGPKTINFVIDGGGAVITTGATVAAQTRGYIGVTANSTINDWTIVSDVSGSIYVDIWKATYANFPTMTLITGTDPPRLVTAQKNTDSAISGTWGNTSLVTGDILEFRVNNSLAVASVNTVTVILGLTPQA